MLLIVKRPFHLIHKRGWVKLSRLVAMDCWQTQCIKLNRTIKSLVSQLVLSIKKKVPRLMVRWMKGDCGGGLFFGSVNFLLPVTCLSFNTISSCESMFLSHINKGIFEHNLAYSLQINNLQWQLIQHEHQCFAVRYCTPACYLGLPRPHVDLYFCSRTYTAKFQR